MSCLGCEQLRHELRDARARNTKLLAAMGIIKRCLHEQDDQAPSTVDQMPLDFNEAERLLVVRALARAKGNRSDAAKLAGVARSTFFTMLKRHGIEDVRSRTWRSV